MMKLIKRVKSIALSGNIVLGKKEQLACVVGCFLTPDTADHEIDGEIHKGQPGCFCKPKTWGEMTSGAIEDFKKTYMMIKTRDDKDVESDLLLPLLHQHVVNYNLSKEEIIKHQYYISKAESGMKEYEKAVKGGKTPQESFIISSAIHDKV